MKLPDILAHDLKLVFVGTAVGNRSSAEGRYYAGRGNKFWPTLLNLELFDAPDDPDYEQRLLDRGIGLTDLAKHSQGADRGLKHVDFDIQSFLNKMNLFKPRLIAFNGKRAFSILVPKQSFGYGPQPNLFHGHRVFVLPSTSGAARRWWDEGPWRELRKLVS